MAEAEAVERAVGRFYVEVGRRVRVARGTRTQAQVASALGMTRSSIANLEAGRQRIPLHVLAMIARVVDAPISQLLPDTALFERVATGVGQINLKDEPESTRDFIEGAMAQLKLSPREG